MRWKVLLIDDILLSPFRGLLFVLREIHNGAEEQVAKDAEDIKSQLSDLYMMLETGRIANEEFEVREKALLDEFDRLHGHG